MTFEQAWEAARFNDFYWAGYIAGAMFIFAGGAVGWFVRNKRVRRIILSVLCLACFWVVADLGCRSISEKWALRRAAAQTQEQWTIVANRDTGNLAFSSIIGGLEGLGFSVTMGFAAIIAGQVHKRTRTKGISADQETVDGKAKAR